MVPLEYQVTPGMQLSALNFELSWKIATYERQTHRWKLTMPWGLPTKAQLST